MVHCGLLNFSELFPDLCVRLCLQYLVDCDEVIFMRDGSITEQGSHEDLMSLNGDYAAMFNNLQLGEAPYIEVRHLGYAGEGA